MTHELFLKIVSGVCCMKKIGETKKNVIREKKYPYLNFESISGIETSLVKCEIKCLERCDVAIEPCPQGNGFLFVSDA